MSGGGEDYKSYTPVVGRMKSKRWVQATSYNYDGDEWGDEYDEYEEYGPKETEAPPMPAIPQQFLDQPVPLQLGTTGEKQKLDTSDEAEHGLETRKSFDEQSFDKQSIDGQSFDKEEISVKPTEPSVQEAIQSNPDIQSNPEGQPEVQEGIQPVAQESIQPNPVIRATENAAPQKSQETSLRVESEASKAVEHVGKGEEVEAPVPRLQVNEPSYEDGNTGGQLSRGHSIVEDIYGYYGDTDSEGENYDSEVAPLPVETHSQAPPANEPADLPRIDNLHIDDQPAEKADQKKKNEEEAVAHSAYPEKEISPPSSDGEWDETDGESSYGAVEAHKNEDLERPAIPHSDYSFDKGSEDYSYTASVEDIGPQASEHEMDVEDTDKAEEQPEEKPEEKPAKPEGRWKPLPASIPVVKKERSQDRLEREILGSFDDTANTEMAPPEPQFQRHELRSQPVSRESFDQVDPEIRELYQNSHQFLQTDYSEAVEPLTTNRSDRGSVHSGDIQEAEEEDEVAAREAAQAEEVIAAPAETFTESAEKTETAAAAAAELEPSTTISSDNTANEAESPKSRSTSESHQYKSMIIDEPAKGAGSVASSDNALSPMQSPISPVQSTLSPVQSALSPVMSTTSASKGTLNYAPASSVKPQYDFLAILSRGKTADRYAAFNDARQKEYEYGTGLESWLAASAEIHKGGQVYTSGRPPPPTETESKLAMPSRTVSSTFIRPAKHVVNSHVMDRIGEKSTKKAKGLFAKGKKLIS